ncbi:MAG TPA: class I SAM-dependent methyltransferase [Dehalococcoidia bacterium]|nr:class I SAM-dependent methyltransferase [Dehalococcoidia bacterium]
MSREVRRVSALEGYDLWADTYDATPNPVVAMDARHSLRVLTPAAGELILDAGCGTGRNLGAMVAAGAAPVGIDFSAGMLKIAHHEQPGVRLALADLQRDLPIRDASFDAVLCALVGEHLADLPAVLAELRRVIKPGGRLVFSVYHPEMAAAGIEANFDLADVEYRLGAQKYGVQDYLDVVSRLNFDDVAFASFKGDDALARLVPAARRFIDQPMLLVIAAIAGQP